MGKVTILGHDIRIIRPEKPRMPIILKKDLPRASYNKRPRVIKENSGKVAFVTVRLKNGAIRALTKGMHIDVIGAFGIDTNNVAAVGWELENGNYVWK